MQPLSSLQQPAGGCSSAAALRLQRACKAAIRPTTQLRHACGAPPGSPSGARGLLRTAASQPMHGAPSQPQLATPAKAQITRGPQGLELAGEVALHLFLCMSRRVRRAKAHAHKSLCCWAAQGSDCSQALPSLALKLTEAAESQRQAAQAGRATAKQAGMGGASGGGLSPLQGAASKGREQLAQLAPLLQAQSQPCASWQRQQLRSCASASQRQQVALLARGSAAGSHCACGGERLVMEGSHGRCLALPSPLSCSSVTSWRSAAMLHERSCWPALDGKVRLERLCSPSLQSAA